MQLEAGGTRRAIAYLSSDLGVKAVLFVRACGGGCVLCEGVARRSWMIRRKLGGMRVGVLAPWTPCLIWARGCAWWRPVT